eukprot:scaffold100984_cov30-Prasinocladus_malaysianus.AAC.2
MFVWVGSQADAAGAVPLYTSLITKLCEGRFPMPEVNVAGEGTGDARYMASRLVPAHRDSEAELELMSPDYRALPAEARTDLRGRLLPAEEPSMLQWCRHYYVHPRLDRPEQIFASLAS